MLGRGSDSEGLAVGLTGPSSSDLRHLPIGLIWLHLSSLIVANIDVHLDFGLFSKLSPSPSFVPGTQKGRGWGGRVLPLRPPCQERRCPSPPALGGGVPCLHVPQESGQLQCTSIGSFSLDSTTDLPLKSWGFRLPEHAPCGGLLQCQAWNPLRMSLCGSLITLPFPHLSYPFNQLSPVRFILSVRILVCPLLPTSTTACLVQPKSSQYNSLLAGLPAFTSVPGQPVVAFRSSHSQNP